ncbi:MAG: hypothetical protein IPK85_01905 [Gemmatimonadetes bacterium]|nr:hypothetical protein [Gemmatimonadota bacterium]
MTTLPRWSDLVTARPDECDPIDHPRIRYDRFVGRVLIVCALAMLLTGYLTGAGWVDYERATHRIELAQEVMR